MRDRDRNFEPSPDYAIWSNAADRRAYRDGYRAGYCRDVDSRTGYYNGIYRIYGPPVIRNGYYGYNAPNQFCQETKDSCSHNDFKGQSSIEYGGGWLALWGWALSGIPGQGENLQPHQFEAFMVTLAGSLIRWQMICFCLLCFTFSIDTLGEQPPKHHNDPNATAAKAIRHDPAFRTGYMDGYRQGSNDSAALSNAYKDESGAVYSEALDGYTPQYGNQEKYQMLFRRGYIEGYKAGWDFNSGQYNPLGAGGGGGSGG